MSRTLLGGAAAVLTVLLTACGGAPAGDSSQPAAPPPTSTSAAPSATPAPSRSPTSLPSPTTSRVPDPRRDRAALRRALVTANDLGRPWVVVEGGLPAGAVEAGCPGKPSAVRRLAPVAEARRDLTEGPGELVNGASFGLATLRDTDGSAVRSAWQADTRACRAHTDADDFYVVYRLAGPTSAKNADEILFSRAELIFFDQGDADPAYARHTVIVRAGRVVTTVSYTFLTENSKAGPSDFARVRKLLDVQLAKVAATVAE